MMIVEITAGIRQTLSALVIVHFLSTSIFAGPISSFSLSPKEAINLSTMYEASGGTLFMLHDMGFLPVGQTLDWTGTYSETGWSLSISGLVNSDPFNLNYAGDLTGDFGETIVVTFAASGNLGAELISTNGTTTWIFDELANDYVEMYYSEEGEINPFWKIVAAEVLIGGVVGGLATRSWSGALQGAGIGLQISLFRRIFRGPPPPPPFPPIPPLPPLPPVVIIPPPPYPLDRNIGSDTEATAIYANLGLATKNMGDTVHMFGTYGQGTVAGTASIVPEPSTFVVFGSGLLFMVIVSANNRRLNVRAMRTTTA